MIALPVRYKIAAASCRRWGSMQVFAREEPEDFAQEVWVAVLSRAKRHDTVRDVRRYAQRHIYKAARDYGFMRTYEKGNNKSAASQQFAALREGEENA